MSLKGQGHTQFEKRVLVIIPERIATERSGLVQNVATLNPHHN